MNGKEHGWLWRTPAGRNVLREWAGRSCLALVLLLALGSVGFVVVSMVWVNQLMEARPVDLAEVGLLTGLEFPEESVLTRSRYSGFPHSLLEADVRMPVWSLAGFRGQKALAKAEWKGPEPYGAGRGLPAGCRDTKSTFLDPPRVKRGHW